MKIVVIALCVVAGANHALCQDRPLDPEPRPLVAGDRFFEGDVGFSWHSPAGSLWGTITHRRILLTGLRWEWVVSASRHVAFSSTVELPLAVVQRTSSDTASCWETSLFERTCRLDRSANLAVGAGLTPFGFKLYVNHGRQNRWFLNGAGGAMFFSTDVPVRGSRRFNYSLEGGAGVEMLQPGGRAITLGYKFYHISNASTGEINPGLDANVLYVGLRRQRANP
jgi:hypothetical protein